VLIWEYVCLKSEGRWREVIRNAPSLNGRFWEAQILAQRIHFCTMILDNGGALDGTFCMPQWVKDLAEAQKVRISHERTVSEARTLRDRLIADTAPEIWGEFALNLMEAVGDFDLDGVHSVATSLPKENLNRIVIGINGDPSSNMTMDVQFFKDRNTITFHSSDDRYKGKFYFGVNDNGEVLLCSESAFFKSVDEAVRAILEPVFSAFASHLK
jgi:hypothetical protein